MPGVTIPHLVDLGADARLIGRSLEGPAAWDALRTGGSGAFALPETRDQWEAAADAQPAMDGRMRAVATTMGELGAASVASYGVGTGIPELWLRRVAPRFQLTATEAAPQTAERLRTLFGAEEVVVHDLSKDAPLRADAHLFHRIDTELANRAWHRVFRRFAGEQIVVVATDVLPWQRMRIDVRELPFRWRAGWQRAGWLRTAGAFESLWAATHEGRRTPFGDLEGWVLTPHH